MCTKIQETINRNRKIFEDILFRFHPRFKDPTIQKFCLHPDVIADLPVEKFVEEALAIVGGLVRTTNNAIADYTDRSDNKVARTRNYPSKGCNNSYFGRISGIGRYSINGTANIKPGAIRTEIYIAPTDELLYYYLPRKIWRPMIEGIGGSSPDIVLSFQYNATKNSIVKFEDYRIKTFKDLALRKP